jgi:hypothetical protein
VCRIDGLHAESPLDASEVLLHNPVQRWDFRV